MPIYISLDTLDDGKAHKLSEFIDAIYHCQNLTELKKKKISVRLSVGALARVLHVHSESGNPSFCNSPKASPNFATLFVLWPVAGTFGYSFDSWRRMTSSTKHTTVIRKGGIYT